MTEKNWISGMIGFVIGAFLVLIITTIVDVQFRDKPMVKLQSDLITEVCKNDSLQQALDATRKELFSPYNLKTAIINEKIKFPDIVFNQAIIETRYFTSSGFIEKNNLFGFTDNKILKFNTWYESVLFYKKWQDKYYHGGSDSEEEYYSFLKLYEYAKDTTYIDKLKKI